MLLVLFHSASLLICSEALTRQSFKAAFAFAGENFILFLLSLTLTSVVGLFLFAIIKKSFISQIPATLAVELLTVISFYKMSFRGSPLELADFSLTAQFKSIVKYSLPSIRFSAVTVFALLIPVLLLVLMAFLENRYRALCPEKVMMGIRTASIIISVLLFTSFAAPGKLGRNATDTGINYLDQQSRNEIMGVPLGLYSSYNIRRSFSKVNINNISSENFLKLEEMPRENQPNIILILSESFFDISKLPNISLSKDPLPYFRNLQESNTNGSFYTDNFGGGTGYIELEVLTGINSFLLNEGDTLTSFPDKYEQLPNIVRNLKDAGYQTVALYSHNNALYNRAENFPKMGFDETLFAEDFNVETKNSGYYVSDDSFADEIIYKYEHKEKDSPVFIFGISMENHLPYDCGKYGKDTEIQIESPLLNETEIEMLESCAAGIKHADDSLKKLVEYFEKQDEPVIIAFFGDHQPSLQYGDEYIISKLKLCKTKDSAKWDAEDLKNAHETEYLFWSNYEEDLGDDAPEGPAFLGLDLLKKANVPLCNYFKLMDDNLSGEMLTLRSRMFIDKDGNAYTNVPEEKQAAVDRAKEIIYAVLYSDN